MKILSLDRQIVTNENGHPCQDEAHDIQNFQAVRKRSRAKGIIMGFYDALLEPDVDDSNDTGEHAENVGTALDCLMTGTPLPLAESDRSPVRWQCSESWKVPGRITPR